MIFTNSAFYYGPEISENNLYIDFNEGAGELSASIPVAGYTLSDIGTAVENVLNNTGSLTYTVSMNRTTRKMTIAATAAFSLLFSSGTNISFSAASALGFSSTDLTTLTTYESDLTVGEVYLPQFRLQGFIALEDWQDLTQANQNESASGVVEVISFASVSFTEFNITLANDYDQYGVVERNLTGVSDLRNFMKYITRKLNIEFLPDRETIGTFNKLLLDKTPLSKNGTGFKLKELYGKGLVGYYESGKLKFREVI